MRFSDRIAVERCGFMLTGPARPMIDRRRTVTRVRCILYPDVVERVDKGFGKPTLQVGRRPKRLIALI